MDGYWAIGKLCSYLTACGLNRLIIDLKTQEIHPRASEMNALAQRYSKMFFTQMWQAEVSEGYASTAILEIEIFSDEPLHPNGKYRVQCTMKVLDDLGRKYRREMSCRCNEHDPSKESRRHPDHRL